LFHDTNEAGLLDLRWLHLTRSALRGGRRN
jgi:hypothetical protein